MAYSVDNLGVLTTLNLPQGAENAEEICNTNIEPTPDCTGMVNLSILVTENYINQLPVDPQATGNGTGYFIAEGSIILIAPNAETRFIGRGITEEEYAEGGETENGFETCGDNITFTYNNQTVTYGTVEGVNDTCWMDRNLGASQVATAYNDHEAYGDLFQWGRAADGHQLITWTNSTTGTPVSGITETLADTDTPDHSDFITSSSEDDWDWRSPQNNDLW